MRRDGDEALIEASLHGPDGAAVATATATARVISLSDARDAA